jgi:superfamily I DNA/RNA helicase/mRNA-degrading endonuclease RelE of RelBE toxin-antitoxin system
MSWSFTHKPSYLSDLIDLPRDLQGHVINAVKQLEEDPTSPRGDTVKKLQGYRNVYRYRLGDFRLIYAADQAAQMINLLAIGPRGSIYKRFNFDGWDAPDTSIVFPKVIEPTKPDPDWLRRVDTSSPLPRRLSPELLTRWRIDPQYHAALAACQTEDDLLALSETVPPAVLERVMEELWRPSVAELAAQPDLKLFDPDDLTRYAEGTLAGFLLHLDERQEPLTRWGLRGPTLVKGGPGSGKSTVALYRARAVIDHRLAATGQMPSVLFTTYTNALTHASESLLCQLLRDRVKLTRDGKLPPEVRVSTVHKTARWIANSSGAEYNIAKDAQRLEALHAARAAVGRAVFGDPGRARVAQQTADLRDDYLLEEFEWAIEGQDCRDEAAYLAADRSGRGIPFGRERRAAVWRLYEAYREHLLGRDLYTWGHLMQAALDRVRAGEFKRRWDYVIVDEAQDLTPAALALAVELCHDPSGVFLTADANQSLYNRGFRWNRVHESLAVAGRTRMLGRNYRSTRQIAAAAAEIMTGGPDVDDEAAGQEYVHSGPRPVIYAAPGTTAMWRWIAEQIVAAARRLRLPPSAAAVLVPSSDVGQYLATALCDHRLPARFMNSQAFDLDAPGVKVTTLHAAKGLEFPIVVVAHVEAGRLPRETQATDPDEIAAFLEAQRRLFYVGCTRAMRQLFVTYDAAMPSPFVQGLSEERWAVVGGQ